MCDVINLFRLNEHTQSPLTKRKFSLIINFLTKLILFDIEVSIPVKNIENLA